MPRIQIDCIDLHDLTQFCITFCRKMGYTVSDPSDPERQTNPIPNLAKGGIISKDTLAYIGVPDKPEKTIPLTDSKPSIINQMAAELQNVQGFIPVGIASETKPHHTSRKFSDNPLKCVELYKKGKTPAEISKELGIMESSVKKYIYDAHLSPNMKFEKAVEPEPEEPEPQKLPSKLLNPKETEQWVQKAKAQNKL